MRLLLVLFVVAGCGGQKVDTAVDQYINKDFAPTHAKIVAARKAYEDIRATDIDEAGKLGYLKFRLREVAAPFLAQALEETKRLTPPAGARDFHEATLSVLPDEHAVVAELATALDPPAPEKFKAAHAKMMDSQRHFYTWEEIRGRTLAQAGVKLAPLPRAPFPEAAPEGAAR